MAVVTYKCPNCSGELLFDPPTGKFHCHYCDSSFPKEQIEHQGDGKTDEHQEVVETVPAEQPQAPQNDAGQSAVYYTCPSCGAEIVTDETTAATFCFYCHNPVVLAGRLSGNLLPDKIIPFAIDKKEAVRRFFEWTRKKWFIPKYFFSEKQVEKFSGVYFPFWLVDTDLHASLEANGETYRIWRTGDTEYTETSRFQLIREGNIHFEDVTKAALKKSDRKLIESVQPFDSKALKGFSMAYLSGFLAEKRDIERASLEAEVKNDVNNYAESMLRGTMSGFSAVRTTGKNVNILNENWDYALLPVWTLTYQHKGKTYYYAMNGQDGKIFGNLPIDFRKLYTVAGAAFAVLTIILMLLGWYY